MGPSQRARAVIADDNAHWRQAIYRVLSACHDVIGYAERGDELIAAASRLRPDIVTLDVSMPGGSGLSVLPALRAALPDAVIVVVSLKSSSIYLEEAFQRGADAYIQKNRVLSDLMPAIAAGRIPIAARTSAWPSPKQHRKQA